MGGEIKVVKKNGPGTLMQLYMVLNTPVGSTEHHYHIDFVNHGIVVSKLPLLDIHKFSSGNKIFA